MNIELEEVMDSLDANMAVVISEAWGSRRIIEKIYFSLGELDRPADCLAWVADNYADLIMPNMRIDVYRVFFGHIVGQE